MTVFAGLMARRPVRLTYAFIGLYIVLFGLSELWGGSDSTLTLVAMGAESPLMIRLGEWWRLLSATALHGGLMHILLNSYVLYSFGPFLEKLLGWQRFVVLGALGITAYLGGAVTANMRVEAPLLTHTLFAALFGVIMWIGLALRRPELLKVAGLSGGGATVR